MFLWKKQDHMLPPPILPPSWTGGMPCPGLEITGNKQCQSWPISQSSSLPNLLCGPPPGQTPYTSLMLALLPLLSPWIWRLKDIFVIHLFNCSRYFNSVEVTLTRQLIARDQDVVSKLAKLFSKPHLLEICLPFSNASLVILIRRP